MPDDALVREVAQMRTDLAADITGLHAALSQLVSKELHDAQLGRLGDRVDSVERVVERLANAVEADRKAEIARREAQQQIIDADRSANRRIAWGAILAAAISVFVTFLRSTGTLP